MIRRVALACSLLATVGCHDTADSNTFDEPCFEDNECLGNEHCVQSPVEDMRGYPGLCRGKNDDCKKGYQAFCGCNEYGECPGTYLGGTVTMSCVDGLCAIDEGGTDTGAGSDLEDEERSAAEDADAGAPRHP